MRTKLSLLCFLVFWISTVSAQYSKPRLQLFTDGGKSLYGLKSQDEKEIRKPEFTVLNLEQIRASETTFHYFWIAEKNGFYGALNDSGVIVIPFEFEKLELNRFSWFVGYKQGLIEVYTLSGEKKYTGTDLNEIRPVVSGFILTQNNKQVFLDLSFQERIPISFSSIEPAGLYEYIDSDEWAPSTHVLTVSQGDKQGIYDLNRGLVIPCKYQDISIYWIDNHCQEGDAAIYRTVQNEWQFLFDSNGKLIDSIPEKHRLNLYIIPLKPCSSDAYLFGFASAIDKHRRISKTRIINIQTGEKSPFYDVATANGNHILCKTGKKWLVLDEHFNEIGHWNKGNASWFLFPRKSFNMEHEVHVYANFDEKRRGAVEFIRHTSEVIGIYSAESNQSNYLKLGLYHYVLDKIIQPEYFQIREFEYEGKPVYWGFKISNTSQEQNVFKQVYTQIDIYDDQLNKLKTFYRGELPPFDPLKDHESPNLFFQASAGKYGAVNTRGELVIPVAYKNHGILYGTGDETGGIYLFGNGDNLGVFDHTGRQIIPEKHSRYLNLGTVFLASNANGAYTIYTKAGEELLDVDYYFEVRNQYANIEYPYFKDGKTTRNLLFFVKGEQLFYLQGETFSLADSKTFHFTSPYLQLSSMTIIDRNGKVIDNKGSKWSEWNELWDPLQRETLPVRIK